ncbi:MAG: hypothetical protein ACYC63_00460 [Armatimonadota bacterium]
MVEPFPQLRSKDSNPAIRLFGLRFYDDQTVIELLIEFLLVAAGKKSIGDGPSFDRRLPALDQLDQWEAGAPLRYTAGRRLDLKLFALLGASNLESRDESHRKRYEELLSHVRESLTASTPAVALEALRTIENLFLGLQGVGGNRAWCAQSFLPLDRELLARESIWSGTAARTEPPTDWAHALGLFASDQHLFLARGGELLYLQVCNALRHRPEALHAWLATGDSMLADAIVEPATLHAVLEESLEELLTKQCPHSVGALARFIGDAMPDEPGAPARERFYECGWCPAEGWQEGWLFALEFVHLCQAAMDPIERLELLATGCAMQVLRSLCAQSARYTDTPLQAHAAPLGFIWAISDPSGAPTAIKQISRRCVNALQRLIHGAIRHPEVAAGTPDDPIYRQADTAYGHKLFLTTAKRLALVVPKQGQGARLVLNDHLLRFLVLSLLPPGHRVTYEHFKDLLFAHYGIAVDDQRLAQACAWSGTPRLTTLGGHSDDWLLDMLAAAGFLVRLSDSDSMVVNPFAPVEDRV